MTSVESETEEDDDEGVTMVAVLEKESLLLYVNVLAPVHVTIGTELSAVVVTPHVACFVSSGDGSLSLISFKL